MKEHFYGNWYFVEHLGEGSFGNVKLAQDNETNDLVAIKIVDLYKIKELKDIEREICILKLIDHNRIVRYYGHRKETDFYYIFFEYITGGELFNWIDPGYPMENSLSFRFSSQILDAINYLHSIGIAHRDLKLENVMLDEINNVKIIDFGLSTIFRYKEKERFLAKMCGSLPYTAPEILLSKEYRAKPADLWSFGVILFALFTGELPWDSATDESPEFRKFKIGQKPSESWDRLDKNKLELITNVFCINPIQRYSYKDICESLWYRMSHQLESNIDIVSTQSSGGGDIPITRSNGDNQTNNVTNSYAPPSCLSQMNPTTEPNVYVSNRVHNLKNLTDAFSQPTKVDDVVFSQMTQTTQNIHLTQKCILNNIARKMTRFYVKDAPSMESLIQNIKEILDGYILQWNLFQDYIFTVNAVDRRRNPLNFKIELRPVMVTNIEGTNNIDNKNCILINIRRNQGDGIEFKKFYRHIKNDLSRMMNCVDVI